MAFATRASLSLSRAASTSAAAPKARRAAAVACAAPESTPEAEPVAPPPAPKKDSFADFFEFKSWGPEVVNGRLAMVAFFTGAAAEMASGVPTLTQFTESHWAFVLATLLIVPASFMPRFQGETTAKPESKENGMWQASTELLNGRAAMVGLSAMFLQEAITGNPVF